MLYQVNEAYVERHLKEEPDESRKICLWSFKRHLDPIPIKLLIVHVNIHGPACVDTHPSQCPFFLFVGKKACCSGSIRHGEKAHDAEKNGHCALD
jgi:hypothetical protein